MASGNSRSSEAATSGNAATSGEAPDAHGMSIPLTELEVARLEALHTARENLALRRQLLDASEYQISIGICQRAGLPLSRLAIDLARGAATAVNDVREDRGQD